MATLFEVASELVREIYPDRNAAFIKSRALDKWRDPADSTRFLTAQEILEILIHVDDISTSDRS